MEYNGSSKLLTGIVSEMEDALTIEDIASSGEFGLITIQKRGVGSVAIVFNCPEIAATEAEIFTVNTDYRPSLDCYAVCQDASHGQRSVKIGTDGKVTVYAGAAGLIGTVVYMI